MLMLPKYQQMKFEDQMKKLQDIVDKLEKEDVDLDESIHLYEEGLQLAKDYQDLEVIISR